MAFQRYAISDSDQGHFCLTFESNKTIAKSIDLNLI
jgi:hypothetical protein